jgi:Fic family protein
LPIKASLPMAERESQSGGLELITDPIEKARIEAENALRQTQAAMSLLPGWIADTKPKLKPSLFLSLHGVLMKRISPLPGTYRPGPMRITHSNHTPPPSAEVPRLVEDLCDYVNENWENKSAIHLAAYVLWRTNWIHPFEDGNGRTARIVSYLVLCAHSKADLPGTPTIPEQISKEKQPYYDALEHADRSARRGKQDVDKLERLLGVCLAEQLVGFYKKAGGEIDQLDEETKLEIDEAIHAAQSEGMLNREAKAIIYRSEFNLLDKVEKRPVLYGSILAILIAVLGWFLGK